MNEQESEAEREQEQPDYTVERLKNCWPMIAHSSGKRLTSIQRCADELNELVGQRNKAIEERDAARADAARGDLIIEDIGEILDSAGVPDLRPKEILLEERVRWVIRERDEARAELQRLKDDHARTLGEYDAIKVAHEQLKKTSLHDVLIEAKRQRDVNRAELDAERLKALKLEAELRNAKLERDYWEKRANRQKEKTGLSSVKTLRG